MNDLIYFKYFIGLVSLVVSIIYLYVYFKMIYLIKYYVKVKGIVTYSNTIHYRYRYKTFCDYKYEYFGKTYDAYDRGYGKNLKTLNEEINILINPNKPSKYIPPMKYNDKNRYLIYGLIYLILFISIFVNYFIYK